MEHLLADAMQLDPSAASGAKRCCGESMFPKRKPGPPAHLTPHKQTLPRTFADRPATASDFQSSRLSSVSGSGWTSALDQRHGGETGQFDRGDAMYSLSAMAPDDCADTFPQLDKSRPADAEEGFQIGAGAGTKINN